MKILARLPSREIEGAHEVLDGLVGEVSSGNQCRVWPAMTCVPETNQTRIAFFVEWRFPSTPEDDAELMAYTDTLMGKPPEVVTGTTEDPCSVEENVEWLRSGKRPKRKRAN
jgi:hypothetical protein